jgi:hypothetical protein
MTVDRSGVGTAVAERELQGEADRFDAGAEVVFWTRVNDGAEGDRIVHVWQREGETVFTLDLEVGGPRWRTWSVKKLHPGSAGSWSVEARDPEGRVLARAEFVCTEPEGS